MVAISVAAFSVFTFAQDKTTTTATPDKVEKPAKRDGREFGNREFHKRKFDREGFGERGFGGRHGERGMMGMMRGINLTDAQKEQLRAIREANRPDKAVMEEIRTIMTAKRDGTITAEQQARLTALKTQAREKGKSVHEQIQGILTAEQKAQIEQRKQEMKQRFEERRLERQQRKAPPTTDKPKTN